MGGLIGVACINYKLNDHCHGPKYRHRKAVPNTRGKALIVFNPDQQTPGTWRTAKELAYRLASNGWTVEFWKWVYDESPPTVNTQFRAIFHLGHHSRSANGSCALALDLFSKCYRADHFVTGECEPRQTLQMIHDTGRADRVWGWWHCHMYLDWEQLPDDVWGGLTPDDSVPHGVHVSYK